MSETKPIPVRLDNELQDRIRSAAGKMGSNSSSLMRFLIETWIDYFEANGEVACLPPDWREIMARLDNRTRAARRVRYELPARNAADFSANDKTARETKARDKSGRKISSDAVSGGAKGARKKVDPQAPSKESPPLPGAGGTSGRKAGQPPNTGMPSTRPQIPPGPAPEPPASSAPDLDPDDHS